MVAPAAAYSPSGMPDFTPAPVSTATSAPSARIFFTVSAVAATRGSAGSISAGTATFMMPPTAAGLGTSRQDVEAPPSGQPADARQVRKMAMPIRITTTTDKDHFTARRKN